MVDEPQKLLVIEQSKSVRKMITSGYSGRGVRVIEASSAEEGLRLLASTMPDAVVLELNLESTDGRTVIRQIREFSNIPIVVLTGEKGQEEKISSLELGADDFMTKPFAFDELDARIRAVNRRCNHSEDVQESYEFGDYHLDVAAHILKRGDDEVPLTPKEFNLLVTLATNMGKVVEHIDLLKEVWGEEYGTETHYVRIHVNNLRKKIEEDASDPRFILTESGVGYRLVDKNDNSKASGIRRPAN
jgi:two-component system KDP operon response regulator KdpE